MLQEDDFDVEHLRILLYLLEEDKRVLDMLLTQTQNPIPTAIDAEDIRALFRNKDEVTTDASDR